jgi:pimeloyl-ACP methyl ester carboxylesterase
LHAGNTFTYKGHPIFFRDEGQGSILLLIHGFPSASWDWHGVWDVLRDKFRLVAPDMIGFGFSAKPRDYDYSIRDQADLHEALLEFLGGQEVHVFAHDYGDTVAQELLRRYEERRYVGKRYIMIRSVCFLNGGLFPETYRLRLTQRLLMTRLGPLLGRLFNAWSFRRNFSSVFGPKTQPTEEELDDFWSLIAYNEGQRIIHKLIRYIEERQHQRTQWVRVLQETKVPIRLINGPEDPVSGAHMAARFRELIQDADVVLLKEIGHYPHIEDPEGMSRAFLEFIDRVKHS